MMSPRALVLLLVVPLLVLAQNTTNNTDASSTITTTILSTSIGLGQGRQTTTSVLSLVVTTVVGPSPTGNSTSNNSTVNSTTSSSSTTPKILPTAPTNVAGGGTGAAPSPGGYSPNGVYGPGDSYIAAATTLARNAITGCLIASGIAGVLLIL